MITKNSVVKIQNLVVNHKSRPVKLNSGTLDSPMATSKGGMLSCL